MTEQTQLSGEFAQKLTKWKKEPSLLTLKQDWEGSKSAHDAQMLKVDRWNDLLHVRGQAAPKKIKGRSSVQPKLVRKQNEWRYPSLSEPFLSSDKLFQVDPSTFEDSKAARQNELVLNHQFRTQFDRVKFIDDYVRSTVDEGTSIIRVGWRRITVPITTEVPVYDHIAIENEEQLGLFKQALEIRTANPRKYNDEAPPELKAAIDYYDETQQPNVAVQAVDPLTGTPKTEKVTSQKILENRPTAEIMNPKNVYIDPTCNGDIDKALFVCVSFETNKAELLKEGKRYFNLEKVNWEGNTPLSQPDHVTQTDDVNANLRDALRKKVVAYEYWGFHDINDDGRLVPIVVTWIGDIIVRMEESPFPDEKLPFVVVPYLPVKRELYGETDAELLEDNQKIIGALCRGLIDLMGRSANGQQGFAKGMLDPLNRRRYEAGQDYEFNPNVSPQNGIVEHKYPEIPQSALVMLNLQNQEAEALTGVKSFSGGLTGESYGDVAAGIRGALDAASKREMAILRRLAAGIVKLGLKIASMNAVFLSEQETIRITNETFEVVNREDLKGNFDMKVDISTAEVDDAKSQDLAFMLQTIGPDSDPAMVRMILAEIAELKRMPELAHRIRTFEPPKDPVQEEIKMLELEKLRMEVEELRSKAKLNNAKAEEAKASADLKDLEFVEQETGTNHARELERQQGQAEGNKELAVINAMLKPKKPEETKPDIEGAVGYNEMTRPAPTPIQAPLPAPMPISEFPAQEPVMPADLSGQLPVDQL
jgi:hypothetical protein